MVQAWMLQARGRLRRNVSPVPAHDGLPGPDMRWEQRQAYAIWFSELPWDWFTTFTVEPGTSLAQLVRYHKAWSAEMHRRCGRQLRQVIVDELQTNGTPHLHGLAFGTWRGHWTLRRRHGGCSVDEAEIAWRDVSGGLARVRIFEGEHGAEMYCTKYIVKHEAGEVRLVGPWPARPTACQTVLPL